MVERGQGRIFELISPKRRFIEVDRDIFGNVVILSLCLNAYAEGIGIELSMVVPATAPVVVVLTPAVVVVVAVAVEVVLLSVVALTIRILPAAVVVSATSSSSIAASVVAIPVFCLVLRAISTFILTVLFVTILQ